MDLSKKIRPERDEYNLLQYNIVNGSGKYLIGTGSSSDGKVTFEGAFKEAPIPRFFRTENWKIHKNLRNFLMGVTPDIF